MFKNYNTYKILKIFLDNPLEGFRLRELGRLSSIAPASVLNYLKDLEKQKYIKSFIKRDITFYKGDRENKDFILVKKLSILYELHFSGIIEFLWEKLSPDAIILYGSYAKGESIENSDVDLFVVGKEKKINVKCFEKILGKKIHVMFKEDIRNISKQLRNNLINGMVLKGYLREI